VRFSQGARLAITRSLATKPFKTCGFIAVAPGIRDHQLDGALPHAEPQMPGVFMVGTDDVVLEPTRALHSEGTKQGFNWQFHEVPDLAHDFPDDFSIRLAEALASSCHE
jgi:predicted esterase